MKKIALTSLAILFSLPASYSNATVSCPNGTQSIPSSVSYGVYYVPITNPDGKNIPWKSESWYGYYVTNVTKALNTAKTAIEKNYLTTGNIGDTGNSW